MLPRQHRLTLAPDFTATVRGGKRTSGRAVVSYRRATSPELPARFGFIVSKAVGPAVQRNLVKRRLRAVSAESIKAGLGGADVVVRALPAAATTPYAALREELLSQLGVRA